MNVISIAQSLVLAAGAHGGGEANLILPDLASETFLGVSGHTLLLGGIVVSALGLLFGLLSARQLNALPVHRSMREISELIYETAKTYLVTQGKFIAILWGFIG
jgi:K(+)-stimulated pyrophosphate-energized sodium pump